MFISTSSLLQILLGLCHVAIADDGSSNGIVFFPTYYGIKGYPRIMTDIFPGDPEQTPPIATVVDQGSANFWLQEKGAIVNYGSGNIGALGPCNITAHPSYNPNASTTATTPQKFIAAYSYGGNGKIVSAHYTVNDTLQFGSGAHGSVLKDQRLALANFTLLKISASNCSKPGSIQYDRGILGVSRYKNPSAPTTGPSFRQDLLDNGLVNSASMSMWFDKGPRDSKGKLYGTALFGGVPSGKYNGSLVLVKPSPPNSAYVGYYVPAPSISTGNVHDANKQTKLKTGKAKSCLVDSGTGTESLAISQKDFLKAAGLVLYNGYPTFNGTCEDLGKSNAVLSYTFQGLNKGKSVTIKVPLANYGSKTFKGKAGKAHCPLAMELSPGYDCVLAAPFNTGMFMAVSDDQNEIALAQGGVSTGATAGSSGLGKVTVLQKGDSLKKAGAV